MANKTFVITSARLNDLEQCVTVSFDKDNDPVVSETTLDNFYFRPFYGYGMDGCVAIILEGVEVARIFPQGFMLADDYMFSIYVDVKEVASSE